MHIEDPPCFLSKCGTTLKFHQSRCENLYSIPQHSSGSICRTTWRNLFVLKCFSKIAYSLRKTMEIYILLYFGILHVSDRVGWVPLSLFQVSGPHVVYPVYEIYLHHNRQLKSSPFCNHTYGTRHVIHTVVGLRTRFSNFVWLNSKLMTL